MQKYSNHLKMKRVHGKGLHKLFRVEDTQMRAGNTVLNHVIVG